MTTKKRYLEIKNDKTNYTEKAREEVKKSMIRLKVLHEEQESEMRRLLR